MLSVFIGTTAFGVCVISSFNKRLIAIPKKFRQGEQGFDVRFNRTMFIGVNSTNGQPSKFRQLFLCKIAGIAQSFQIIS